MHLVADGRIYNLAALCESRGTQNAYGRKACSADQRILEKLATGDRFILFHGLLLSMVNQVDLSLTLRRV